MDENQIFMNNLKLLMIRDGKMQIDLIEALGAKRSAVSAWCHGRNVPRAHMLTKIADYFGVEPRDLLDPNLDINKPRSYYNRASTTEVAQAIAENKELGLLFDAAKDADPEDLQTVHEMLLALKRKERGG